MNHSTSLRGKFVRTMLFVSTLIGLSTLGIVVWTSAQASAEHFTAIQGHIQDGIVSKGRVLTTNHALALRSLTLDNAFWDTQRLVDRAVKDDEDLVYGVFVNSDRATLALSRRGGTTSGEEPPSKDAWKDLGLDPGELLVQHLTTQRVMRLGKDLLEVAAPVVSEEGEMLGTIRYGLSTSRMHDALVRAKRDSDARLKRSVGLITALVSAATLLGLALSRAQAVRMTKPVSELTQAAEELARGRHSVRVRVESGDELEMLGSSFNRMVEELDTSYKVLQDMNRTLEHKVAARTAELALKNRDMQLVLDNVDQGFITLSPNGAISGEPSRIVTRWFGEQHAEASFADYMARTSPAFAMSFRLGWSQVEEDMLPLDVSLDQLPVRLADKARTWSMRYLPFHRDGKLEGVLLVVADVTERLAREREEAEQNELMQGFRKLMLDRAGFTGFLREATGMVSEICSSRDSLALTPLKRTLHTLKGNSGVMGLTVVARLCHSLEDQLAEHGRMSNETLADLENRWNAIREHVTRFLGDGAQQVIEVSESEYTSLVSHLSKGDRPSDVLHQVLTWRMEPAARSLQRLADQAKALANRLGKGDIEVEVRAPGVRLDPQTWAPFYSDLIHVVRNAVDHGLESPEERRRLGKIEPATLVFRAENTPDGLVFEVSDDGRGIDWQRIADRAKDRGLPHHSHDDLTLALCMDGVTTLDSVSQISGRGVGMAAFKNRVDALHGILEVRSARGAGTAWFIRFPAAEPQATETAA